MDTLKNKEVACKILQVILIDIREKNISLSEICKGTNLTTEDLLDVSNRISWDDYGTIMNNLTENLGYTKEDLINIGERICDTSLFKVVTVIVRALYTLPEFYEWLHKSHSESPTRQSFSCVSYEITSDINNNYQLEFKIDEGYKSIWQFYYTSLGVVRILPTIYNLPAIDVELIKFDRGCIYIFSCPNTGGYLSKLRKIVTFPWNMTFAAKSLLKANYQIYESNIRLLNENKRLNKAREELQIANQKAIASRAQSQFLANISHELRTPLNGIIGTVSLMLDDEKDKEKLASLNMINDSSEILLSLLNEVLDFTKLESADIELHLVPFSLYKLHFESISAFYSLAIKKGIEIYSINRCSSDDFFLGDVIKIRQIINNLLSNAVKFCDTGHVSLLTEWLPDSSYIVIQVNDTGIGIPEEQLDNIFSKFVQLDNYMSKHYQGTGLGLSITKILVEKMNGNISVSSELGKGASFIVKIPLQRTTAPVNRSIINSSSTPLRILLVEDNRSNQIVILKQLERLNHQVVLASSGQECIEKINSKIFDLILMDMMMPGMNGLQSTEIIRKNFSKSQLPILALTANTTLDGIHDCMNAGMNEYLQKPIRLNELKAVLSRYGKVDNNYTS